MTVNTSQLLAAVLAKPKRAAVDAKFMAAIWDAFVGWMAESLHAKQPFRCFDLGDFVLRRDKIGAMEFHNPMFVMSEGFAHRYSLLDRRPKTAARDDADGDDAGADTLPNAMEGLCDLGLGGSAGGGASREADATLAERALADGETR